MGTQKLKNDMLYPKYRVLLFCYNLENYVYALASLRIERYAQGWTNADGVLLKGRNG